MWAAILGLLKALPELIGIFKSIARLITEYSEKQKEKEFAKDVKEALEEARVSHDTSKLEGIFRRGNQS